MDQDSAHMVAASKVPMLKPGEYEIRRMRIEQYIQMINHALWEVIENGATLPKTTTVKGVVTVMPITTAEEKAQRRLKVKARSTLMMGIPNEHQLMFNSIKGCKEVARSYVNQKLLRSLSPEWNTLAIVWRNKVDLDTMSMDDLYNNLKVYELEVKGTSSSFSTASTQVNDAYSSNIDNLSNAIIYDIEEIDLRWKLAMLTIRVRRFLKNTRRKLTINGNETIGFDKSKVECYNSHKRGHFARECRALRNQDNKNKESSKRSVPAEEGPNYALMAFSSSSPDSETLTKSMSSEEETKVVRKNDDAICIEEWRCQMIREKRIWCLSGLKIEKKIVRPSIVKKEFVKSKQQEKTTRKTVKQVDCNYHQKQFRNQRMVKLVWNNAYRVNHQNFAKKTHPCAKKNMVPRAVLMKSGLVSINTSRQNISKTTVLVNTARQVNDQGVIDSGCSRHMTGNMSYLTDYEEIDGGYVAFGGNPKGGKITGKCTIKTVLLRVPRKNNMYSVDLKNIVPKGGLTCLFAKATSDESKLWHRRLGHLNFKTMNKLVKGNLVRGLPSKLFENDQTCVACQKGKQHRASCKSKTENSTTLLLHLLHMDLFGPTFVKSLMKKMYCLVVTDDYSRFTWVLFLATKDKTSGILKSFIIGIENLVDHKVKVIRCDNGTEFKNREMNQFCEMKGILRQFSVARTPQQNRVAERRNMTLIEAARTMLADSKLPTTF
ncbi:putative ribonuclease H-like domain-containing protein [Tanacetum coccineum]